MFGYMDPVIQVNEGDNITLNCQVLLGNPPPQIGWTKGGNMVTSDDYITSMEGTLIIDDIRVCSQSLLI